MTDAGLTLGVIGTSRKPDERRVPIHPGHFDRLPDELRSRLIVEQGYGERFGVADDELLPFVGRLAPREEVIAASDVVLLPKPQLEDLRDLRDGQVLWGWPHLVQDERMTQLAIDKRLTVIAFEAMNHWGERRRLRPARLPQEQRARGVLLGAPRARALRLDGRLRPTAHGGGDRIRRDRARRRHGASGARRARRARADQPADGVGGRAHPRGAHHPVRPRRRALSQRGHHRRRPRAARAVPRRERHRRELHAAGSEPSAALPARERSRRLPSGQPHRRRLVRRGHGLRVGAADIVRRTRCSPSGGTINYYGVDHSPSYLWNSASWEISEALLRFIPIVMGGPSAWAQNETIRRATEIADGVDPQSRDPRVPVARFGISASGRNILTQAALHEIHSHA